MTEKWEMDKKLFTQIFSDAHVVDFDLSNWDEGLVLYVLADHMEHSEQNRKPLFAVEFMQISRLIMDFPRRKSIILHNHEHYQWMIDDCTISSHGNDVNIVLSGLSSTPRFEVSCKDVRIRSVDLRLLDDLVPDWDEPSKPFVRPSIEILSKIYGPFAR